MRDGTSSVAERIQLDFVPQDWITWMPPLGQDSREHQQRWFVLRFKKHEHSLDFYAEIRRMADQTLRRAIIDLMFTEGPKYGLNRKSKGTPKESDTRISSRERVIVWSGDEEPDSAEIRTAVKKKLDELFPKLGALPQALKMVLNIKSNIPAAS